MTENGAAETRAEENGMSPALIIVLADMVEAALKRGAKARPGVSSTKDQPASSKESAT